ncbi:Cation/H+ exchanger, partial [Pavlovales sp. CCMP2436]
MVSWSESEEQQFTGVVAESDWSIVAGLGCLLLTFLIGRYLESCHFNYLPEAGVAILLGILTSALAAATGSEVLRDDMKFDFEFFMVWLLPPIIFEAGFNMNRHAFFANLLPTALFAFVGTLLSTAAVGGIVFAFGRAGICAPLGALASLYFGSLISATDPVTVLAVFSRLGVKADLFAMVFGESVLNDAVAIVLSRTLLSFKTTAVSPLSVASAVGTFVVVFGGSLLIGVCYGAGSALLLKHVALRAHEDALYIEAAIVILCAWGANFTAEALNLSGIVAILFCGIVMAKYTRDNLSEQAVVLTARALKLVALLAETFIFVYLGMAAFAFPIMEAPHWRLVLVAMLACFVGRSHWLVSTKLVPDAQLPPISLAYQAVIWFSGLRGGVAFAIAAAGFQRGDFGGDSILVLQTTLMVAFITIFLMGGLITDLANA